MTDATPQPGNGSGWDTQEAKPYTLPRAEAWIPGESVLGLLVRNTRPQGFLRPALLLSRIMQEHQIDALGVRYLEDKEAQAFADLLGMPRAAFDLVHHGSSKPYTVRLFGHVVHAEFVSLGRRRVCPLCLLDSPHHRSIWDFSLLTVCPDHGVPLIDRCQSPKCSRILTWATPSVTACSSLNCVASLVDAPPGTAEQRLEGVRHLVAAIMGNPFPETPDWPVNSIIRFTFDLGHVANDGGGRPRPIGFAQKHPELMPGILDAGWKAIANWPQGFRSLMVDLRAKSASRPGRWGLRKEFGGLAVLMETLAGDPAARPLLDEFSAFVAAEPALATRAAGIRKRRSETGQAEQFVTANEAKRILGVTYTRMHELATLHDLWLVPPTGSGASSLIRQQKLLALAKRLAGALTKKGAAEILNTSKGTFRAIEALGLVRSIPEGERLLPERLYEQSAIREFLGSLEAAAAEPDTSGTRHDLVTPDMLARGGINIAEILSAVVAGRIQPQGVDAAAKGLHRLLLDPVWMHRTLSRPAATMSTNAAAAALGVKQEVAYAWVRRGLIVTVRGMTHAERGYRITEEALANFRREYVAGTEVAKLLGMRARWVSVKLAASGVLPVSGPAVDGCRQFLFRRAEVEKHLLASAA
jgi:TniQ